MFKFELLFYVCIKYDRATHLLLGHPRLVLISNLFWIFWIFYFELCWCK